MEALNFNTNFSTNSYSNNDVLSVFKETTDKNLSIHQGMSAQEISEIVSEKVIAVVKKQFDATKTQFENKAKR